MDVVTSVVENFLTTEVTVVHRETQGKSKQTLTPDYMHLHATAASAEMALTMGQESHVSSDKTTVSR